MPERNEIGGEWLHGRTVLVTGASRGIGAATAKLLARHGAAVAVNYLRDVDAAREVVAEIAWEGARAVAVQADVRDADAVSGMLARVRETLGEPDTLVLNAAVGTFQPTVFADSDWAEYDDRLLGEMKAAYVPCRALLPSLLERQGGCIVAISSGLSRSAIPGFGTLSVGKAGLEAFVRSLAQELGPSGIRVNAILPSLTQTEASQEIPDTQRAAVTSWTPLRRLATPEDIAGAVLLLASDHARFITGACLPVCGGQFML